MTSPVGSRPNLPGLEDLTLIGTGSFSTVFRARQRAFDRIVAAKVLHMNISDPETLAAFNDECAAAGRLSEHPNIVTLYGSDITADHRPYIVMAHYSGGSLAGALDREGPLRLTEVLRIGVKISSALEASHRADVLHRDVKPGNILMSGFGEPVLGDFGIASLGAGTPGRQLLTPNFAAPEALLGGPATAGTDLYSLAATLFTLLTGTPPFVLQEHETTEQLAQRVMDGPLPTIQHPEVDAETEAAILGGLVPDRAYRLPSAMDLGRALQAQQRRLGLPITELVDGSTFRNLSSTDRVIGRPRTLPPPPPVETPTPTSRSVSPWLRIQGAIIDLAIALAITAGALFGFRGLGAIHEPKAWAALTSTAFALLAYHVTFAAVVGASPGRRWTDTTLVRTADGRPIPLWAAFVRALVAIPSAGLLGLGYLAALTRSHQTIPDRATGTTVASSAGLEPPPRGWTLACVGVVVIVIAAVVLGIGEVAS